MELLKHSESAKQRLDKRLQAGEIIDIDDISAFAVMRANSGNEWKSSVFQYIETTIFYQDSECVSEMLETDCDEEIGVVIGNMKIYRVNRHAGSENIKEMGDAISGSMEACAIALNRVLGDSKEGVDDKYFNDDASCSGMHPYILEEFDLLPAYRKKKLGYPAMHVGLQSSGCEGSTLFIYPSESKEDEHYKFLLKFYREMDKEVIWMKENKLFFIPIYNYGDSVEVMRDA